MIFLYSYIDWSYLQRTIKFRQKDKLLKTQRPDIFHGQAVNLFKKTTEKAKQSKTFLFLCRKEEKQLPNNKTTMEFISKNTPKYNIGLSLSGGGAKGFAHIGALKALTERGIRPDIIAGTSAGSIAGAFYAAGVSPERTMRLFVEENLKDFVHFTLNGKSFLKYDGFAEFLERSLPVRYFEDLKIPLYVVASNFDTGEYEVFSEGELIPRLLASCTIPVIFPPIKINGMRYVDGGLFMNLPVTPIRDICETVIGINVSPYLTNDDKENMIYVAAKSFQYIFNANTAAERQLCDILLEIKDMESYNIFDLHSAKKIYHIGYRQMRALLNI